MALLMLLLAPDVGKAANAGHLINAANSASRVDSTNPVDPSNAPKAPTTASALVWTLESNSPGIHQKGLATSQVFRSPTPVPAGSVITSVRAQRKASRAGYLATTLCTAPAAGRCVVLQGGHVSTRAFNGMPADQVFYLTHTVMGEGHLTPPMFVRASVTVWYSPPGGQ